MLRGGIAQSWTGRRAEFQAEVPWGGGGVAFGLLACLSQARKPKEPTGAPDCKTDSSPPPGLSSFKSSDTPNGKAFR